MTLQLNICGNPEVERLLLQHNNRSMKALNEALKNKSNRGMELPMAIIMDQRCGIERRAEEADGPWYLVDATPLLLAFDAGRFDVAQAILAAGADPNAKDSTGDNSLMVAARYCNLEAIELLVSYGADINAVDKEGKTVLHHAARHASAIEFLEGSGPNLEAVDKKGRTPLHWAASICRVGPIKALLMLGANQAAVDDEGRTPLHCAAAAGYEVNVDVIEAFMAAFEANLRAVDKNGRTPLQVFESCSRSSFSYSEALASKVRALLTPTI